VLIKQVQPAVFCDMRKWFLGMHGTLDNHFRISDRADSSLSADTHTDDAFSFSVCVLLPTSATIAIVGDIKTIEQE
jgi:hypothetical protein